MSGGGEAHCAEWSYTPSMLRGLREAPMPRGGPCAAERRPVPLRGGPCTADRRPLCQEEALCAAERRPLCRERRPLCREEALCAGRSSVLRGLEEAPVSGGGPCASRGGPLCPEVPCAERIGEDPCVGRGLTMPNGSTLLC